MLDGLAPFGWGLQPSGVFLQVGGNRPGIERVCTRMPWLAQRRSAATASSVQAVLDCP